MFKHRRIFLNEKLIHVQCSQQHIFVATRVNRGDPCHNDVISVCSHTINSLMFGHLNMSRSAIQIPMYTWIAIYHHEWRHYEFVVTGSGPTVIRNCDVMTALPQVVEHHILIQDSAHYGLLCGGMVREFTRTVLVIMTHCYIIQSHSLPPSAMLQTRKQYYSLHTDGLQIAT